MPNAHAQFTCKRTLHFFFAVMVAFRALTDQLNPCESIIWCLTTAVRNFYQPIPGAAARGGGGGGGGKGGKRPPEKYLGGASPPLTPS